MTIGENLKKIRAKTNLTQGDIAACFSKDRSTYTCWETGRSSPSLKNLIKLSKIFDCSIDDIIFGEEKAKADTEIRKKASLAEPESDPIAYLHKNEQLLLIVFRLLEEDDKQEAIRILRKFAEEKAED